jgi:hypothetical protein
MSDFLTWTKLLIFASMVVCAPCLQMHAFFHVALGDIAGLLLSGCIAGLIVAAAWWQHRACAIFLKLINNSKGLSASPELGR